MGKFIQYEHYDNIVWVEEKLKGKHRDHCLCFSCEQFRPNQTTNCEIAQGNFDYCIKHGLTLPVWECPKFIEGKPDYTEFD